MQMLSFLPYLDRRKRIEGRKNVEAKNRETKKLEMHREKREKYVIFNQMPKN